MHQNNAFASDRDNFEVYLKRPDTSLIVEEPQAQMNLVEDFYNQRNLDYSGDDRQN